MLQDAMDKGEVFNVWYQAVGTGSGKDSWTTTAKRLMGNFKASNRDFKPLSWQVSKEGNLLATVLDVSATLRKAVRWQSEGKLNELWGGDLNAFRVDMEQYLRNHADGKNGDNLIGMEKKKSLNAFFGVTAGAAKAFNPLKASLRGDDRKSLVKSFRIDRMQNVKPTGQSNFWFDYEKQRRNLSPAGEVAPMAPKVAEPEATVEPTPAPEPELPQLTPEQASQAKSWLKDLRNQIESQ
jgi:hypothetical protein